MPEHATVAISAQQDKSVQTKDDALTMAAISVIAGIVSNIVHEGIGHGLTALLTGAKAGVLTSVAWSSAFDSRVVEAGGTLANLVAALVFWLALRNAKSVSTRLRYFLLITCAFNLFSGTGYFLFSGLTNFGDWAVVIAGMHPHGLWRVLLVLGGTVSYVVAALVIGIGLVRYVGIPRHQQGRLRKLTIIPYLSAILLASVAGLLNPLGIQLLWKSALPATAGGQSGLLWLQYCIPQRTEPLGTPHALSRSYLWIMVATILAIVYVVVLGRGVAVRL